MHYNTIAIPELHDYYAWCFDLHNKVNIRLNKKTFNFKKLDAIYTNYVNNKYKIQHTINKLLLLLVLSYDGDNKEAFIYFINSLKCCDDRINITHDDLETWDKFVIWFEGIFNVMNNKNMCIDKIRRMYLPMGIKTVL